LSQDITKDTTTSTTRKAATSSPKLSRLPRYSSSPDLNNGDINGRTSPLIAKKNYNNKILTKCKEENNGLKKMRRYSNIEIDNKKIETSKSSNQSKLPHFSWNKYASDGRQSPHPQRAFLASDGRSSPHPGMRKMCVFFSRRGSEGATSIAQRRGSMSSVSNTSSTGR